MSQCLMFKRIQMNNGQKPLTALWTPLAFQQSLTHWAYNNTNDIRPSGVNAENSSRLKL